MSYVVEKGATIAQVTRDLNTSWQRLRDLNPHAVGRLNRNGNYFFKEGAVLNTEGSFHTVLETKRQEMEPPPNEERSDSQTERDWITHTVKKGDTLWALAVKKYHVNLDDLIRDNGIEDPKSLQPGQELRVQVNHHPEEYDVVASWYGEPYHGRPMANGEIYNMHAPTIAHPTLPLGTRVELENPETGVRVKARITDRGPFIEGREVDLSYGLAKKLSFVEKGVGKLLMKVLGGPKGPAEFRGSELEPQIKPGA